MPQKNIREKFEEIIKNRSKTSAKVRAQQKQIAGHAYAAGKLIQAIEILATGKGNVRTRLLAASSYFTGIKREDFPKGKRRDWDKILKTVARFEPVFETGSGVFLHTPKNATWGMKDVTAQRAAKQLFELYWSVTKNQRFA